MDQKDEEYYEAYFDLFSLPGWQQLKEEVIVNISNLEKSTLQQGNKDQFLVNCGYVDALKSILNFDSFKKAVYEDISNPTSFEGDE